MEDTLFFRRDGKTLKKTFVEEEGSLLVVLYLADSVFAHVLGTARVAQEMLHWQ